MPKKIILFLITFSLLLAACLQSGTNNQNEDSEFIQSISDREILELICGENFNCLESVCLELDHCPIRIALSNPVVFVFVKTYSSCEGCNIPDFLPELGIGKCIEYEITTGNENQQVRFQVSENCSFRYADPKQVEIFVNVDTERNRITQINPALDYIENPSFCISVDDCRCLSGSGVPLIGASNYFYAPLNPSGFFQNEECGCVNNQCSLISN